jgi:hypothetical protein
VFAAHKCHILKRRLRLRLRLGGETISSLNGVGFDEKLPVVYISFA